MIWHIQLIYCRFGRTRINQCMMDVKDTMVSQDWEYFKTKFEKKYEGKEDERRYYQVLFKYNDVKFK